jgi:hypothetical protein
MFLGRASALRNASFLCILNGLSHPLVRFSLPSVAAMMHSLIEIAEAAVGGARAYQQHASQ